MSSPREYRRMRSPREYRWRRGTKTQPCSPLTLSGQENEEMVKTEEEQLVRQERTRRTW